MVLSKFVRREIATRPGRAILTLLSIVVGVAAVVAVQISTNTTKQAYQEMFQAVTGRAAYEVVAQGGGLISEQLDATVAQVPGVKSAVPTLQRPTVLIQEGKRLHVLVMGIDPQRDDAIRDYQLESGTLFGEEGVLIEPAFAHSLRLKVGDEIKMYAGGRVKRFPVVGLLALKGTAGIQTGVIFLPMPVAQALYAAPGKVSSISVVLREGVNEATVVAALKAALPVGHTLQTPATRTELASQTMQDAEKGLNAIYVLMVALALVMILNTFLMNVGERRRQLAILRAVGTTRGQLIKMLLMEGLLMGAVGTVLGCVAGVAGASALSRGMADAYETAAPAVHLTVWPFVVAAIVGPGMSLLAMFIPALIAGRISPLEGMRPSIAGPSSRLSFRSVALCLGVFLASGLLLLLNVLEVFPVTWTVYTGTAFSFAMVFIIMPLLGPLARTATFFLSPILGTEGRIAGRQVVRRRLRTTLTVGILYVALATCVGIGTQITNSINDVRAWLSKAFVADFFVRAMASNLASGEGAKIPEAVGDEIRQVNGVGNVDSMLMIDGKIGEQAAMIIIREFTDPNYIALEIIESAVPNVRQALLDGEVVLGMVLAKKLGVEAGGSITLGTRDGPQSFRVAAIAKDYMVGGLVVHMARGPAKKALGIEGVNVYMVQAPPERREAAAAKLAPIAESHGLLLHSLADVRARVEERLNGIIACLWGLMFLGFIVCAFAVANTLTMNVLEQTRDLALLRVVAMTRAQVRKTVMGQAIVIGTIGVATGLAGGIVASFTTNYISARLMGHGVTFEMHPLLLLIAFVTAVAVTLIAALMPAIRASKLNLLIALQYE